MPKEPEPYTGTLRVHVRLESYSSLAAKNRLEYLLKKVVKELENYEGADGMEIRDSFVTSVAKEGSFGE